MQSYDEAIFPQKNIVYASFWQRLAAVIIDAMLIAVTVLVLRHALFQDNIIAIVVFFVFRWLYYALQESGSNQATIGKKALNIKVVNYDTSRISFGKATGRYFAKNISAFIIFIGFFMVLWDDYRQALHDKIAATYVICS